MHVIRLHFVVNDTFLSDAIIGLFLFCLHWSQLTLNAPIYHEVPMIGLVCGFLKEICGSIVESDGHE